MEDIISLENNLAGYFFRVVNESVLRRSLDISHEARAYIVLVADRFFGSDMFHTSEIPLTFRLAEAEGRREDGAAKLQYIGDECMFLTGYFRPFVARSGSGQVEYVSAIGAAAYNNVGVIRDQKIFFELAQKFPEISGIFQDFHTIRPEGDFTEEEIRKLAEAFESLKKEKIIYPAGLN